MKTLFGIGREYWIAPILFLLSACSSTYSIDTEPSGAMASLKIKDTKVVLGQTPLDFSSSQIPDDQTFSLEFSKQGFETKTIDVAPIKQSRTILNIKLDTAAEVQKAQELAHSRKLISDIFAIQELVFRRKFVDALTEIRELEKREVQLAEVYALKGSIYYLMNDFEEAKNAWKQALKLDQSLHNIRLRVAELEKLSGAKP